MTRHRSHGVRRAATGFVCASLFFAGCGAADPEIEVPSSSPEPVSTDVRVNPILSSALDDEEFEAGITSLLNVQRVIDTDELRAQFVEVAGGQADRLDEVDLATEFILIATTGQCVVPTTPPTLVIGSNDATVVDVDADGDQECYRPLTVVHFFAVDDEYRDRFPLAIADLDGVIHSSHILTADDVTQELLDELVEPTFVDGDADVAALAAGITDADSRARSTSFAHQAKLLVPARACVPRDVTTRIRLLDEARVDTIDPGGRPCEVDERYIVVFTLGDAERDRLRSISPSTWNRGLTGLAEDLTIVMPSGPQRVFVGAAALGEQFEDLATQKFSTSESMARSTLGTDVDFPVTAVDVDLTAQFFVVVVRRDCDVLSEGNAIIIRADSWESSPPVPDALDCEQPNVSIAGYVIDRQYLDLFDDVPEGPP